MRSMYRLLAVPALVLGAGIALSPSEASAQYYDKPGGYAPPAYYAPPPPPPVYYAPRPVYVPPPVYIPPPRPVYVGPPPWAWRPHHHHWRRW